ncbi:MAG: rod shape-determining protein MreC [Evtepia sp.]
MTLASAWVIARTPDNWQGEVTLDQGRAQKVAAGQCVIDENGALAGRVKEGREAVGGGDAGL